MMNRRRILVGLLAAGLISGGFIAGRVLAAGIPATGALTYSGVLEGEDGKPLTGKHTVEVKFWATESGGDEALCTNNGEEVTLVNGRFSVALPDGCTDEVKANPDLWVEVRVDGASLGRAKAGAVPFAVEAGNGAPIASIVASLLDETEFAAVQGPGWVLADGRDVTGSAYHELGKGTNVPDLRGMFLRGKNNGREDELANPEGEFALGEVQEAQLAQHGHSVTDPGHDHQAPTTDGNTGSVEVASPTSGGFDYISAGSPMTSSNDTGITIGNASATSADPAAVGDETRPQNVTVNYFIRVN
ncbi:MAG: hypothetical protein JW940_20495 [Polyangiaceae bacterium]|nr:hypothetical protein [Polyangiaceae bacterium]